MKAMIFAAGLGTRLKPITDTMPKALVPVWGKPLLWHIVSKLKEAGYDDIVINIHHFAQQIRDYVASQDSFGVRINFSDETDLLRETGGGILHARELLEGCGSFPIHNVDIISDLDLKWFREQTSDDHLATLLVSERQSSRYLLFNDDMRLVGWTNAKTGELKSPFTDINIEKCRKLAFSGIHYMSDKIFDDLQAYGEIHGEKFSIIDFYLSEAASGSICGIVPLSGLSLVDVGKVSTLKELETSLFASQRNLLQ